MSNDFKLNYSNLESENEKLKEKNEKMMERIGDLNK